ncbi:hypothetical protein FHG87_012967 [Trinorchestia longiramus]|nr:hypothetical protein FHG87_012967 [Trinorchestia longiramus]
MHWLLGSLKDCCTMRVTFLLAMLAVGCQSSQPLSDTTITGRKIGNAPIDFINHAYLPGYHSAYPGYSKQMPKIERHDEVVIDDGETVFAEPQQTFDNEDTVKKEIEVKKPVKGNSDKKTNYNRVKVEGKPTRLALQKRRKTVNVIFEHLFEIIQDVIYIATKLNRQSYAIQRKDNTLGGEEFDAWPLLKGVFLKYIKMLRETDLMDSLGHIIPVYELEEALEYGDAHNLLRVITESVTPRMFAFLFDTMHDFLKYITHVGNKLETAELREYIPSGVDILYPFRIIIGQALGLIEALVSRDEMRRYWGEFRSFSPFAARSLEYFLPYEDQTTTDNAVDTSVVSEKSINEVSFTQRALEHPFALFAGVGSAVAASVYLYGKIAPSEVANNSLRKKRSANEEVNPADHMNPAEIQKIIVAVEQEPTFDDAVAHVVKPKKSGTKKFIRPKSGTKPYVPRSQRFATF